MNFKDTQSDHFEQFDDIVMGEEFNNVQFVPDFQISLNRAKLRTNMMEQFVSEIMKEGVDYGVIPGFPKPSLFKSGAEKLTDIFGFSKRVEVLNRVEDWEVGFFHYEIKVTLVNKRSGLIEAEGIGSCNSKEKKFKYNDTFTIVNTVLKIAKKRAVVDAVLSATRSSSFFTQDVEDMDLGEANKSTGKDRERLGSRTSVVGGECSTVPSGRCGEKDENGGIRMNVDSRKLDINEEIDKVSKGKGVTKKQLYLIYDLATKKGLSNVEARNLLKEKYGLFESKELSSKEASDFISYLQDGG